MATLLNCVYSIIYITHTHTHTQTHTIRSLMNCTPYSGDQIEKSGLGGTCSTYGGQERILVGKPEGQI